jgi:glycoside/pentoside/hexuronide:cation symporter, GPH family
MTSISPCSGSNKVDLPYSSFGSKWRVTILATLRKHAKSLRLPLLLGYAIGECANSLVTNGLLTFGLLCYTDALGLSPAMAGAALAVSVFVEAVTQPLVGYVSDNTRSRWGRRHPFVMVGGLLMAAGFYFAWAVPAPFRNHPSALFGYLVGLHVVLRLSQNVFFIPYLALGYEITRDDRQRTVLQSLRQVFNMAANFAGPAMAWTFFFRNHEGERGTGILENYVRMGGVFSGAIAIFILVMVVTTWSWGNDSRAQSPPHDGKWVRTFLHNIRLVFFGRNSRQVLIFLFMFTAAMVVMSSLQFYLYEHCLRLSGGQKTVAHGSTMVLFAIGALVAPGLSVRLDKRRTIWGGGLVSIGCNLLLATLFLLRLVPEGLLLTLGKLEVSVSLAVFVPLHAGFWLGAGIVLPVVNGMMADVSEVHRLAAGVNRDGSHAAAFNLAMQLAISVGITIAGLLVAMAGFVPGPVGQAPEIVWRLAAAGFLAAPAMILLSLLTLKQYRVTHELSEARRDAGRSASLSGTWEER